MQLQARHADPAQFNTISREAFDNANIAASLARQVFADQPQQLIAILKMRVQCLSEQKLWPEVLDAFDEIISLQRECSDDTSKDV